MAEPKVIPQDTFSVGAVHVRNELHISGGLRATMPEPRQWSLGPLLSKGKLVSLKPMPIQRIDGAATELGELLFGGDEIAVIDAPLVSRVWTPLNGPHQGGLQAADVWGCIASNAADAGDEAYASVSSNIAHSLRAAGIRLRDASDGLHKQLIAAHARGVEDGGRFTNLAATDVHLAFHSVLTELASARDYLAAALGSRIGAPSNIDAMSKLARWLSKSANAAHASAPVIVEALAAYDRSAADPWLFELTEYRNQFVHRSPFGAGEDGHLFQFTIKKIGQLEAPLLHIPLSDEDQWAPGEDAFKRFILLYRRMNDLLAFAAANAPYDSSPPHFIISGS